MPLAPAYRGWFSVASQQKYPSNFGGMKILDEVIADLAVGAMPPWGSSKWYGLALYVFGSIMTVQAFTDGNKRMSRFACVLMLLSEGSRGLGRGRGNRRFHRPWGAKRETERCAATPESQSAK